MNKRKYLSTDMHQRLSVLLPHNNSDLIKSPSIRLKGFNTDLFDGLKGALTGFFREVFNALNPAELNVITFLKMTYSRMVHPAMHVNEATLKFQLIPIVQHKEDNFLEVRRLD